MLLPVNKPAIQSFEGLKHFVWDSQYTSTDKIKITAADLPRVFFFFLQLLC